MPAIVVPTPRVENPTGGGDRPFPAGNWNGTIEKLYTRTLDYLEGRNPEQLQNQGFTSPSVEAASIQIGQNRPLDGQDDVGAQKYFAPNNTGIIVRDGDLTLESAAPEYAWQILRSQAIIANLALALGHAQEVEGPDGEDSVAVSEGFVDALFDGEFEGQEIGFETEHRPWTSKDGSKSGVEVVTKTFRPAV